MVAVPGTTTPTPPTPPKTHPNTMQPNAAPQAGPAPTSNEQYIWDYFLGKGLSAPEVAGILGNLQQESGFNPEAVQPGGPGRGLAQWSVGGRWQPSMMTGNVSTDLLNQLNYMWQELQSNPGYGLKQLEGATDPYTAAQIFGSDYERYGIAGARNQDAVNIYNLATAAGSGYDQSQSQAQGALGSGVLGQLGPITAGANQQLAGLQAGGAANIGQQQLTDTELQQQYQNALASLGIQETGLTQQGAYQKGQYGIQQFLTNLAEQYAGKEYGFEQQQQALSTQNIQENLASLKAQYGYQQQQDIISRQQQQQGEAASGVLSSGTERQAGEQFGLQKASEAQQYGYNVQQQEQALKQLGLTGQEQQASYANQLAQLKEQGLSQGMTYGYQEQQLQNALAQLGLQRTQAGQQYSTGQQQAANTLLGEQAQQMQQQGGIMSGMAGQIQQLLAQLTQAAGGYTGG